MIIITIYYNNDKYNNNANNKTNKENNDNNNQIKIINILFLVSRKERFQLLGSLTPLHRTKIITI